MLLVVKNPPAIAGDASDVGSISKSGRSPGGGSGNPLQYSCLEYSVDRGAWGRKEADTTERLSAEHHLVTSHLISVSGVAYSR